MHASNTNIHTTCSLFKSALMKVPSFVMGFHTQVLQREMGVGKEGGEAVREN